MAAPLLHKTHNNKSAAVGGVRSTTMKKFMQIVTGLVFSFTACAEETIPEEFHGVWAKGIERCDVKKYDYEGSHRIYIDATSIGYYESGGKVKKIERTGESTLNITLRMSGEGGEWELKEFLSLSPDKKILTQGSESHRVQRVRCASN